MQAGRWTGDISTLDDVHLSLTYSRICNLCWLAPKSSKQVQLADRDVFKHVQIVSSGQKVFKNQNFALMVAWKKVFTIHPEEKMNVSKFVLKIFYRQTNVSSLVRLKIGNSVILQPPPPQHLNMRLTRWLNQQNTYNLLMLDVLCV